MICSRGSVALLFLFALCSSYLANARPCSFTFVLVVATAITIVCSSGVSLQLRSILASLACLLFVGCYNFRVVLTQCLADLHPTGFPQILSLVRLSEPWLLPSVLV